MRYHRLAGAAIDSLLKRGLENPMLAKHPHQRSHQARERHHSSFQIENMSRKLVVHELPQTERNEINRPSALLREIQATVR
jgi:hypothetical protein